MACYGDSFTFDGNKKQNVGIPNPWYFEPYCYLLQNLCNELRISKKACQLWNGLISAMRFPPVIFLPILAYKKQTNSVALSPRANYTDWSTATWRNLMQTFVDRRVSRGQRGGSLRPLISVF
jgi:hypothetical protein